MDAIAKNLVIRTHRSTRSLQIGAPVFACGMSLTQSGRTVRRRDFYPAEVVG